MTAVTTRASARRETSTGALLAVLVTAVVGFAVQQTSVVPAVETVRTSLHSSSEWSAWLVTVYLIVATVATPAMGRLADLHGRRMMLLVGLVVFLLGSVAATFAPSMPVLILCRAVQGIGGAVYPLCLAIARDSVPPERVTAVGALTAAFGVGTAVGFVGGGALAQYASWRWIFAGGAAVIAIATALVWWVVPDRQDRAAGGFDIGGTVVIALSVIGMLTGLTLVVPLGWSSPAVIVLLAAAVAAAAGWTVLETRRQNPLVDLHVLQERAVAVANLSTIGLGWALFSAYLLVPELLETDPARSGYGLGAGPALVGLLLLPLAIGQAVAAAVAGVVSPRVGPRRTFGTGLLLVAAALIMLAFVHRSAALVALLALLLGAGAATALQSSSAVATEGVAGDVAGVSSALNSTVRRFSGGIGGQVSTIVLASLVAAGTGGPSFAAYMTCFAIAAGICLLGVLVLAVDARTEPASDGPP